MDIFTILKMIALSGILKSVVTAALSYITQFLITASHAVFLRLMLIEAVYVLARGRIFITLTWRYSGNMKINGSMEEMCIRDSQVSQAHSVRVCNYVFHAGSLLS